MIQFAIPSARRPWILASKTIPLLQRAGVDPEQVTVFVPDEGDRWEYEGALPRSWGSRLVVAPHTPEHGTLDDVGVRPHGLGVVRNTIARHFPAGTRLVQIDDDIDGIIHRVSEKESERSDSDLLDLCEMGFDMADDLGASLWGIYPVKNPYFMKDRIRTDLTYICGGLFGVSLRHEDHELVVLDDKEDFERSLRHFVADGAVVRVEHTALLTQGYSGDGGMQASRTSERVDVASRWLCEQFPELASLNTKKKSGWTEVRLRSPRR